MFKKLLKKKESGFTIIEVMIVLAIAGLILVVVLIAVPQLQRNQRNSARQAILGRISTEIGNYIANNNGRVPTTQADLDSVRNRYLSNVNIEDPSSGVNMPLTIPAPVPSAGTVPTAVQGTASYASDRSCNGEQLAAGTARSYALWTQLEGGAIYCLDNL